MVVFRSGTKAQAAGALVSARSAELKYCMLVEDMLKNDPPLKRPAEEMEKLDKSALIQSSFVSIASLSSGTTGTLPAAQQHRPQSFGAPARAHLPIFAPTYTPPAPTRRSIHTDSSDDEEEDEDEDDDEETEYDRQFINDDEDEEAAVDSEQEEEEYRDEDEDDDGGGDDELCEQYTSNSTSYTCSPGAIHLNCTACLRLMPERSDINILQACEACKLPYRHLYRQSQNFGGCVVQLQPVGEWQLSDLPPMAHKSNRVEQRFTKEYLDQHGLTIQAVVKDWVTKVDRNEIALSGRRLASTSVICESCAMEAIAELMDKFRSSIPKNELPTGAAARPDCWYGYACRTQVHNPSHAERLNHICEPTAANCQR